jgi:hypothetical protein
MAIHFNHTILSAHDSKASAIFLAEMLISLAGFNRYRRPASLGIHGRLRRNAHATHTRLIVRADA